MTKFTAQHFDHVGAKLSTDEAVDHEIDGRVDRHQNVAPVGQVATVDF